MKNCQFQVVGTNRNTKHLEGEVISIPGFNFHSAGYAFRVDIQDEYYFFDIKVVKFLPFEILIEGFVANSEGKVGRISLKYLSKDD